MTFESQAMSFAAADRLYITCLVLHGRYRMSGIGGGFMGTAAGRGVLLGRGTGGAENG
jgi:hypothetical protein